MSTNSPVAGQRWVSDSEPELGLGIVLKTNAGRIEVLFPAANEHRQYALKSAPLRRVQYKEGDRIKLHSGENLVVERIEDRNGLLVYHGAGQEVEEAHLSDSISFSTPEDRLLAGQIDELFTFDLRVQALYRRSQIRRSVVRGFAGGRLDLIPHQLFIASEVSSRLLPRVLLADEVGLGKTIEACLILHRLHLTGRAERALVLVPEPLIHQWFVELLRRFNLLFSIFDEERCESIQLHNPEVNPFLDSQLILCSVEFLRSDEDRAKQAVDAGWDLLIVDEAHHLEWSPQAASPEYQLVEALAAKVSGLLLLTATPQQLGPESHFARLRLLDPDRYGSVEAFLNEANDYEHVAKAVDRLLNGKALSAEDRKLFGAKSERIRNGCEELLRGDESARARLVPELLDAFGTGRVMFRNTRVALAGFPERKPSLVPLDASAKAEPIETKIKWLAKLLKDLAEEKVLLICKTRELAEQIHTDVQREINVNAGLFHEGLTLLQRDRNAAYFADEEGARILICSEIGSEGRNFQFAHHLVLFDLPADPELLEQRIGRLDRIGQTATIQIHVPYVKGTDSEVLARWYHDGLNAFENNVHGATEIARTLEGSLQKLCAEFDAKGLKAFIAETRKECAKVTKKLERGHDRLLELSSCKADQAQEIVRQIQLLDGEVTFEKFFITVLDHFGVHVEELSNRTYLLQPGHLRTEALPSLPEEGMSVTFDRARALGREDLAFLTWDHPLVRGALDLLLGSESGNAAFGVWKNSGQESVLIEIYTVAECVAPAALHVDRFLPATPIRIAVDHTLANQTADEALVRASLEKGDVFKLLDKAVMKKKFLPAMLDKAQSFAGERLKGIVEAAVTGMNQQLDHEISRLEDLRKINDHVRLDEIEGLRKQKTDLGAALQSARLRLDAVRLILRVP